MKEISISVGQERFARPDGWQKSSIFIENGITGTANRDITAWYCYDMEASPQDTRIRNVHGTDLFQVVGDLFSCYRLAIE